MGIISRQYVKKFVCRYDKEVGIPYYAYSDFKGLERESFTFSNSRGVEVHYFIYCRDNYLKDKIVLFLPGIGPGHVAYLREIETLTKLGYRVLTLDYSGCGESKGKNLRSLNGPTRDVLDLLEHLKLNEKIILMGHSLGGYTALNVLSLKENIDKAVAISPFLTIESLATSMLKSKFIVSRILKYERKAEPKLYKNNLLEFLKNTDKEIIFIHSDNDQMVPSSISSEIVKSINNKHIHIIEKKNRKHNPNYTDDAVNYMNEVFGQFLTLQAEKKIKKDQEKIDFFKDVSLERLTNQDEELFGQIASFIGK